MHVHIFEPSPCPKEPVKEWLMYSLALMLDNIKKLEIKAQCRRIRTKEKLNR